MTFNSHEISARQASNIALPNEHDRLIRSGNTSCCYFACEAQPSSSGLQGNITPVIAPRFALDNRVWQKPKATSSYIRPHRRNFFTLLWPAVTSICPPTGKSARLQGPVRLGY